MSYNPKNFDYASIYRSLMTQWGDWSVQTNTSKVVIGISGGKDSTVIAALAARLYGAENVLGVLMPNGEQEDIEDSYNVVKLLGIQHIEINIAEAVNAISSGVADTLNKVSCQTEINLPARIRMATLYAVAQTWGGKVINTCNKSEDYVGYATLFGDASGSYSPFKDLLATQVVELGIWMGLPEEMVRKAPTDGLCGKTDEDNLGFTYLELDNYIYGGINVNSNFGNIRKIKSLHERNKFKLEILQIPGPGFKFSQ